MSLIVFWRRYGPSAPRSFRLHPDAAVNADRLGVHVAVGDALDDHAGELLAGAEPMGEQHTLLEVRLELLAALALAVDRRVDQARRHRVDSNANGSEITSDRQRHADDAALGRR